MLTQINLLKRWHLWLLFLTTIHHWKRLLKIVPLQILCFGLKKIKFIWVWVCISSRQGWQVIFWYSHYLTLETLSTCGIQLETVFKPMRATDSCECSIMVQSLSHSLKDWLNGLVYYWPRKAEGFCQHLGQRESLPLNWTAVPALPHFSYGYVC